MPVDGYNNKRVWQYNFLPQPVTLLDRGFDIRDHEWEKNLVERLRRGEAAPRSLSVYESCPGEYRSNAECGWEAAERHAKNADRTKAVFLNDYAIEMRKPGREARKKAWEAQEAIYKEKWEQEKVRRQEEDKKHKEQRLEEARIHAEYMTREAQKRAEQMRIRKERDAEWNRIGHEVKQQQDANEFQRRIKEANEDFWRRFKESQGLPGAVIGAKYGPSS
jgi:hypothetical protein